RGRVGAGGQPVHPLRRRGEGSAAELHRRRPAGAGDPAVRGVRQRDQGAGRAGGDGPVRGDDAGGAGQRRAGDADFRDPRLGSRRIEDALKNASATRREPGCRLTLRGSLDTVLPTLSRAPACQGGCMNDRAAVPTAAAPAPTGLEKRLGLFDGTMLVAGSMIGSGIFIVSAEIARDTGGSGWLLAVWAVAGLMTVLGALSYGELAAMMPQAGGQYVY